MLAYAYIFEHLFPCCFERLRSLRGYNLSWGGSQRGLTLRSESQPSCLLSASCPQMKCDQPLHAPSTMPSPSWWTASLLKAWGKISLLPLGVSCYVFSYSSGKVIHGFGWVKGGLSAWDTTLWGPGSPQFASYIYKDVFLYRLTDRKKSSQEMSITETFLATEAYNNPWVPVLGNLGHIQPCS